MSENIKSFIDTFNAESKKQTSFNEGHRRQLDALKQIVSDINAVEGFSAEIGAFWEVHPSLHISAPSGDIQSFFIQFGKKDPATVKGPSSNTNDQDTILLTNGLHREPLAGNENGYDLTRTADRDECLRQISKKLMQKIAYRKLEAATVSYTNAKPPRIRTSSYKFNNNQK